MPAPGFSTYTAFMPTYAFLAGHTQEDLAERWMLIPRFELTPVMSGGAESFIPCRSDAAQEGWIDDQVAARVD
jgi:hypothetical protein